MREERKGKIRTVRYFDFTLLFLVFFACAIGLVIIYSSSAYIAQSKNLRPTHFLMQQLKSIMVGTAGMLVLSLIDYKWFKVVIKFKHPKFLLRAMNKDCIKVKIPYLMLFVMICLQGYASFLSEGKNGSKRWLEIFGMSIQPVEFAKFAVIIFGAYVCCKFPKELSKANGSGFLKCLIFVSPLIILIAKENMSSAIITLGIFVSICFVASDKKLYFFVMGALSAVGLWIGLKFLGGYRAERIEIFLNLESHEKGQQILQGLYAIASGGIFGKGLGGSEQKYGRVPEAYNDMVFTIIVEELGLFGGIAIIIMFMFIISRIIIIIMNTEDKFGAYIGVGIMSQIAIQTILNIAVVNNMIPSTGIALPFISYGGTAVIIMLCEIGVLLNIAKKIEYKR